MFAPIVLLTLRRLNVRQEQVWQEKAGGTIAPETMFTFHWSELLVVIIGGLLLFLGLALVMLRRRNEVLQRFLTPEDPNLEEEFFRVRQRPLDMLPEEEEDWEEEEEMEEAPEHEVVQWGATSGHPTNGHSTNGR